MKIVAVTGANGFVGRQLCLHIRRQGGSVRAIVRVGRVPPELSRAGLHVVEVADLHDSIAMESALQGASVVVHLAGLAHAFPAPSAAEFDRVNHGVTVAVARAAVAAGVRRFILLSTIKVNGEASGARAFEADDIPAPQDDYARSKLKAERALLELVPEPGLEPVIIRPPLVYGPGVRANFARLVSLVERGWPLPFGAVHNRRTMVSLGNLIDLITVTLDHPAAAGKTFLAGDGRPVSTPELIQLIGSALGRSPRLLNVPESWMRAGARLAGKQNLASRLLDSLEVSIAAAGQTLGWVPPVSVEDGIAQTVAWLQGSKAR